ncbi:MAG: hypothetical protein Q4F23_00590 [Coriobacteriia bacterium]|nr:hypothetical protein [Coriobacteriia bacterium]
MKLPELEISASKKDQAKISLAGLGALLVSLVSFVLFLYLITVAVKLVVTFWGA